MKTIISLVNSYKISIQKIESKNVKKNEELKLKLKEAKKHLHQIRIYARAISFNDTEEEINFFKNIKPNICGQIKFFKIQLAYKTEKPFVSIEKQKKYIRKELKILEFKKKKNQSFYRYIKQDQSALDEVYFVRGNEQLALFSQSDYADIDPEFSTSHDLLASEVITYDLTSDYFKKELHCLANLESGCYDILSNNSNTNNLIWTASKTDLVELIYALKVSGAINGGDTQIKELTEFFGQLFHVDLGNYYKTYGEIKNRQNHQTKFLSKLTLNLEHKLEMDDN